MTGKLTAIRHPELDSLYAFWHQNCPDGGIPMSSDMEPADLRRWLGHMLIMDVVAVKIDDAAPSEKNFRYAYYGRSLAEAFGENRLGQTLERLPGNQRKILESEYELVRLSGEPMHRVYTADFDGVERTWERLVLPLTGDGESVDKILVAAYEL
ncbi:MAG TPA: PAS domain-containing protein [Azospirillaceae bacterium]|nr:PAS domain-containing protein [Azospirillaceae bacterium]